MKRSVLLRWASVALAAMLHTGSAVAVGIGDAAPPFSLATSQGETIALERLRGQVVYVDFWASWCGPCKRSFPWMNELAARYGRDGFTIVAVNVDKKAEDAQRFLAATPARFTVVYDAAGATPSAYAVKGMPSSYLVDRSGRVVMVEQGFRDEDKAAVEGRIRELLAAR
ncbi:MAG TPA: TlpA disulfide reductase family protein [Casimicrobiaceae bacterium]|jgi:thiol-disulfide isomerase/thioredoxin|nr:TlpA disulfide reductase family protein [Casimicrobiaceae bacterium]